MKERTNRKLTPDFDVMLELNNQQHHGASLHRTLSWQPPDVGALGTHFIGEDSKRQIIPESTGQPTGCLVRAFSGYRWSGPGYVHPPPPQGQKLGQQCPALLSFTLSVACLPSSGPGLVASCHPASLQRSRAVSTAVHRNSSVCGLSYHLG